MHCVSCSQHEILCKLYLSFFINIISLIHLRMPRNWGVLYCITSPNCSGAYCLLSKEFYIITNQICWIVFIESRYKISCSAILQAILVFTYQRHAQSLPLRESTFPNQAYYGTVKGNMVFCLCFLGCIWNPTPSIVMEMFCHEYTPWLLESASCLWSQTLLCLK